jgi:hypothetical protein
LQNKLLRQPSEAALKIADLQRSLPLGAGLPAKKHLCFSSKLLSGINWKSGNLSFLLLDSGGVQQKRLKQRGALKAARNRAPKP